MFCITECNCNLTAQSNDLIGLSNRRIQMTDKITKLNAESRCSPFNISNRGLPQEANTGDEIRINFNELERLEDFMFSKHGRGIYQ